MQISVIIPTLHERGAITGCIESAWAAGVAEVIVADGGSDDGTARLATDAGATVVAAKRGRGPQMNAGAAAAKGDVLLFLHADARLTAEIGSQIEYALADPQVTHGAFQQRIDAPGRRYRWLEAGNAFRVNRLGTPYGDQALFVRREAFQQVDGFPDEPLMEDVAIARRLRRLGWPALLDGPVHVSPRRWQEHGVVRQTLKNWSLLAAWTLGVPPGRLTRWYKPPTRPNATPQASSSTQSTH